VAATESKHVCDCPSLFASPESHGETYIDVEKPSPPDPMTRSRRTHNELEGANLPNPLRDESLKDHVETREMNWMELYSP
jgi:hypothetical protein